MSKDRPLSEEIKQTTDRMIKASLEFLEELHLRRQLTCKDYERISAILEGHAEKCCTHSAKLVKAWERAKFGTGVPK